MRMARPKKDLADLRRNTLIWIVTVAWVLGGYFLQLPPAGPYASGVLAAFTLALGAVVVGVSLLLLTAWILALRETDPDR